MCVSGVSLALTLKSTNGKMCRRYEKEKMEAEEERRMRRKAKAVDEAQEGVAGA